MQVKKSSYLDSAIKMIYSDYMEKIRSNATNNKKEECLSIIFELWMFMNRFRNCDLGKYFDEEIHDIIKDLNPRQFTDTERLKSKSEYNIAFIITNLVDTGGASVPHRFILENPSTENKFNQFLLVSNLRNTSNYEETEGYKYIKNEVQHELFTHIPAGLSWLEKGEYIENWLRENNIDFVLAAPCPATLYALASQPALVQGILSQDCYCFTLGPGSADITFLVTTDQVFKYKFSSKNKEEDMKVMMLPLHQGSYIDDATPFTHRELNIPENAIVSGSTNMWKTCFGDGEVLLEGIARLIRLHPEYHHIFAGTSRCLDNVEFFLNKNKDIKNNIHYLGSVRNIYRLLKTVDFWINSFPTSGGSDIESAIVGKPTIELLANRNLNLHGAEFLRSRECDTISLEEFVSLGTRFITDQEYRHDLGLYLKQKIKREFDKEKIISEKVYNTFINAYNKKLKKLEDFNALDLDETVEYEKMIGLYNGYINDNWDCKKKWSFLEKYRKEFPLKPFAWIKSIEECILTNSEEKLAELEKNIAKDLFLDYRIHVMLSLAYDHFGYNEKSIEYAKKAYDFDSIDNTPYSLLFNLLLKSKKDNEALNICKDKNITINDLENYSKELLVKDLPIYYNY